MPPLRTLPQLSNINGNKDERRRRITRAQNPIEKQDVVTKSFADDTYVAI